MTFTILDHFGQRIELTPHVELYRVYDFMGKEMPGLAIVLDTIDEETGTMEQFAVLTVSFGEFISLRNSAYIDVNNCWFAPQLVNQGIAKDTGLKKQSGYCEYPLWLFYPEFLEAIGGEQYQQYRAAYDTYSPF